MKMSDFERIRLVILGGAGVGKSCIIKRFLFKTYSDKYRPTVEDLYNREYDLGSVTLKVSGTFVRSPCRLVCETAFDAFNVLRSDRLTSLIRPARCSFRR